MNWQRISGIGAVVSSLTLMSLYIYLYTFGAFPWSEKPAPTQPTNIDLQTTSTPASERQFMPGSKSDSGPSQVIGNEPRQFLSGTKSFSGATTVTPGTLEPYQPGQYSAPPPVQNNAANESPRQFLGGSKSIVVTPAAQAPNAPPKEPPYSFYMGGGKSPNNSVYPKPLAPPEKFDPSPLTYDQSQPLVPLPQAPAQQTVPNSNGANQPRTFMSGGKSPIREVPGDYLKEAEVFQQQAPAQNRKP